MPQNAWVLRYADVIGLCDFAYVGGSDAGATYLVKGREWKVETIWNSGSFRAILATGMNLRVLSFSGSDDRGDWGMNGNIGNAAKGAQYTEQYNTGLNLAREVKPDFYTGHSLGGGIALYCCCLTGIRAATVNPSPIFNSISGNQFEQYKNTQLAINYCVDFEMLAAGRLFARAPKVPLLGVLAGPKNGVTPGRRVSVTSSAGEPVHAHLLSFLEGYETPVRLWIKELK